VNAKKRVNQKTKWAIIPKMAGLRVSQMFRLQSVSSNPRIKKFLFLLFFFVSVASIFRGLNSRWILQNGDTAGFVDAFKSRSLEEFSSFVYGSSGFQLIEVLGKGLENFSAGDLINKDPEFNVFNSHAYLLPYLFRNFSLLFNSPSTLPLFLVALSYGVGFATLMKLAVDSKLTTLSVLTSTFIVVISPIFFFGLIGQPYMDRLFFGPCILVMYLIHRNINLSKSGFVASIIVMTIAALISERASLIMGIIVFLLLLFQVRKKETRNRYSITLIFLSLILIFWYFIWSYVYSTSPYSANMSIDVIKGNLQSIFFGNRQNNFISFALCLAPFLISGVRFPKYLVISLVALIPNLFVSVGGAELTGYASHYHALYLPAIVFSVFVKKPKIVNKKIFSQIDQYFSQITISLLAIFVSLNYIGQPAEAKVSMANAIAMTRHVADALGALPKDVKYARQVQTEERKSLFRDLELKGKAGISSPEGFMPVLVSEGASKVDAFPIGVGSAELVVVPFTDDSFNAIQFSLFGLVPVEDQLAWSALFMNILELEYVQESKHSGSYGHIALYVLKK
jgi:hypothetical protein